MEREKIVSALLRYFLPPFVATAIYEWEKASLLDYEVRYREYRAREI